MRLLKKIKRYHRKYTAVLVAFFFIVSMPATSSAFSVKEEQELGAKLLYSVRGAFPLVDDPDIDQYINSLGDEVLRVAGIQYFDYHFYVVDSKDFNAFAAPSGLIFFYSGLIAAMNSEDELVSVLAHEIGHVVRRHLAARMDKGKVSTVATAGLALLALLTGGALAPALLVGAMATGRSISLHYSRIHEEEADLLAYDWMKALHRDPQGQVKMLGTMRRIARYRSEKLPQYLVTHPNPEARLEYVESLVIIDKKRGGRGIVKVDNFAFFRFKYRVLSQVTESASFRDLLISLHTSARSTEFEKKMSGYGLALVALRENDYPRSLQYINQAIKDFPDKIALIGDRGYIQLEAGQLVAAEQDLRATLARDAGNLFAIFNLGRLMARRGDITQAEKYYKSVLSAMPEYDKAYYELGRLASSQKKKGMATYYLGKYNLYRGRLRLARFNFNQTIKNAKTTKKIKEESEKALELLDRLQGK
ncbi:beta-barrel assembly-enhancing protease [Desulfotalea psychrophila]|uniref:beta-barrel assembly-enhancing protease n=1 Tax=Desulfotalea psychrophila TaxID=84980 RepID=UPI0002EDBBD5|nr:M48 family metallopeptidase [Desulfotalea psychrophila]